MSGMATGWVFRHGPKDRGMRLVMLAVADAANRDGEHAHPGLGALAESSLYSNSHIRRVLGKLCDGGWLEVEEEGGGRGKATVYRIPGMKRAHDEQVSEGETRSSETGNALISDPETRSFSDPSPSFSTVKNNGLSNGARKRALPDPFFVTEAMRNWATETVPNVDLRLETAKFCDHWRSKGEKRIDWIAAWRLWMRRSIEYGNGRTPPPDRGTKKRQMFDALIAEAKERDAAEAGLST